MNTIIRKGKKADLPALLKLIQELAIYEKAPREVEVTLAEMERWGFGKEKVYDFFVAEIHSGKSTKKIVGMALYYIKYSTWKGKCIYLDDLIVNETYRRHGIGKRLFEKVIEVSKQMNVRKMEWQVLHWNKPAIKFYKKYQAHFDNEWVNCKLIRKQF